MKELLLLLSLLIATNYSYAQKKENLEGIEIGMLAPDIQLPNIAGDTISLYDFKGKIVLINFWASWCSPCRKKTPELLKVNNEFQSTLFESGETGFVLFNVSLDRNEDAWRNSVDKDNMHKSINVGDMNGWKNSAASSYSIKSIPSNVLIDGNGEVLEINLSTKDLKKKLKRLKKNYGFWKW